MPKIVKLRLTILETFFLFPAVSLVIYGLAGVFLGNLGLFQPGPVMAAAGLISFLIIRRLVIRQPKVARSELVIWLSLPLMAVFFFPPFEYIFGGRDPGVYLAVGAGLAQTGKLHFQDQQLASLSLANREFFYRLRGVSGNSQIGDSYRKNRQYPGLFVTDLDQGKITPQFYPFYPVLLAGGYYLKGLVGAFLVTPLLMMLGLIAVYLFSRELFNEKLAVIAFGLLLLSYPVVWYARYPNSESVALWLFFSGSWLALKAFKESLPSLLFLAGLTFAALALTRIDSLLLVVPLFLVALDWRLVQKNKFVKTFVIYLSFALALNLIEGWFFSKPYFLHVVLGEKNHLLPVWLTLVLLLPLFLFFNPLEKVFARLDRFKGILAELVALSLFVLVFTWQILGVLVHPASELANLFKLEWYLTPPVVLLGIWGLWVILKKRWPEPLVRFSFSYALFSTIFYLYHARVSLDHPWWVRRYLPVAIPFLITGFTWLVLAWAEKLKKFWLVYTFGFISLVYLGISLFLVRFNLFSGALRFLNWTTAILPQKAVVVAVDDWGAMATPLRYLGKRQVVPLNPDQPPQVRTQVLTTLEKIFPDQEIWLYSFEGLSGITLPPEFALVGQRVLVASNYRSLALLPLTPGEPQILPLLIYRRAG